MPENFFKAARDKSGLTQMQAAIEIGVTTSAVSGWENGQTPRLHLADKIAKVYGVSVSSVLNAMKVNAQEVAASSK